MRTVGCTGSLAQYSFPSPRLNEKVAFFMRNFASTFFKPRKLRANLQRRASSLTPTQLRMQVQSTQPREAN